MCVFYVVVVAVVVVVVYDVVDDVDDVDDDEEGGEEEGGEDAQRRKSNNPNLKGGEQRKATEHFHKSSKRHCGLSRAKKPRRAASQMGTLRYHTRSHASTRSNSVFHSLSL